MRSVSPNLPQSGSFWSGERGSKATIYILQISLCTNSSFSVFDQVDCLQLYAFVILEPACLVYAAELPKRDDSSPKSIMFSFSCNCESKGSFQHGTGCKYLDKSVGSCAETKPPDRQQ